MGQLVLYIGATSLPHPSTKALSQLNVIRHSIYGTLGGHGSLSTTLQYRKSKKMAMQWKLHQGLLRVHVPTISAQAHGD